MRVTLMLVVLACLSVSDVKAAEIAATGMDTSTWQMVVVGWMFGAAAVRSRRDRART